MAATKCTMLLELATNVSNPTSANHRVGGWSESWYNPAVFSNAMQTNFETLCRKRAALLPVGASVKGQRYQQVDPSSAGQSTSRVFPGAFGTPSDIPQMALLARAKSVGRSNTKSIILRGMPDIMVVEGEIVANNNFITGFQAFVSELGSWYFRGRDLTQQATPIVDITSVPGPPITGLVVCEIAHNLIANEMVRVLKTNTGGDDFVGGRFQVLSITSPTVLVIRNWPFGNTVRGKIRKDVTVYPQVAPTSPPGFGTSLSVGVSVSRIITKKVGRPFTQYRGRR